MSVKNDHVEEAKPFLDEEWAESPQADETWRTSHRGYAAIPWIIAAVSWIITIYILLSQRIYEAHSYSAKENVTNVGDNTYFPTDFEALRSTISYESRDFTGALYYDVPTKRFIRNTTTTGPAYVGPPTKAIDAAWDALLDKEWAPMTEEESLPFQPRLTPFVNFYRFEPDVLHSLHCVNEIRKRIDVDYYLQSDHASITIDQEDWDRIHIDHCIDQIRQSIMCFGDLSPVPLYYWDGSPLAVGQGTTHTCRKWDPVRQWVDQRHLDMNDN